MARPVGTVFVALAALCATACASSNGDGGHGLARSSSPSVSAARPGHRVVVGDVWVRVRGVDSDHDGRDDRVHVEYVHDRGTRRSPVVIEASPYWSGGNTVRNHNVDVPLYVPGSRTLLTAGTGGETTGARATAGDRIGPTAYERLLRPRGYAYVYAESLGSGGSTGCPTAGAPNETKGIEAVVRWLTGRATAVNARGKRVRAWWSSRKVAMIGVSYNGTLANAVATTGVRGLRAIVPISAISSWYDYYRAGGATVAPGGYQGEDTDVLAKFVLTRAHPGVCKPVVRALVRHQDRRSGDYSRFWASRNYLPHVDRVRAAVLAMHGLADSNVKTSQFAQWYLALRRAGVPHKVWLHPGGHGDPEIYSGDRTWSRTLVRWFDRWLKGARNGIAGEPKATVVLAGGSLRHYADWPAPGTSRVALRPHRGGRRAGTLSLGPAGASAESLVDDARFDARRLASMASSPHRLLYQTRRLSRAVTVSGLPRARLEVAFSKPAANVSVGLLDIGPARRVLVAEAWVDPQNRHSLSVTRRVRPGRPYALNVRLQAVQRTWRSGHRIGLVLLSSDHDFTLRPPAGTRLRVRLRGTSLRVPVVGGLRVLRKALS